MCIVCKRQLHSGCSLRRHVLFHIRSFHNPNFRLVFKYHNYGKVSRYLHPKRKMNTLSRPNRLTLKPPYKCSKCNKAFAYQAILKLHLRTHKLHRCKFCSKAFRHLHELQCHYNIDKHYRCEICDAFFNCDTLLQHNCLGLPRKDPEIVSAKRSKYATKVNNDTVRKRNEQTSFCSSSSSYQRFTKGSSSTVFRETLGESDAQGGRYTCDVCSKNFEQPKELEQHTCLRIDGEPYCYEDVSDTECSNPDEETCMDCGASFAKDKLCNCNNSVPPDAKPHVCELCSKAFLQLTDFEQHACLHIKDSPQVADSEAGVPLDAKPHVCGTCSKAFLQLTDFEQHACLHIKDNHQVADREAGVPLDAKPHICKMCSKAFLSLSDFEQHACLHIKDNPQVADSEAGVLLDAKPHICGTCSKAFRLLSDFEQHSCFQIKDNPQVADSEAEVLLDAKPHVCGTCSKAFRLLSDFEQHACFQIKDNPQVANSEASAWLDEKPHICETCSKAFLQIRDFEQHACFQIKDNLQVANRDAEVWLDAEPHICETCSKAFLNLSDFEQHACFHIKDNPQVADSEAGVRLHEEPHICKMCSKAFLQLSDFEQHTCLHIKDNPQVLLDAKPHVCETCSKAFMQLGDFELHACFQIKDNPHLPNSDAASVDVNDKTLYDERGHKLTGESLFKCQIPLNSPQEIPYDMLCPEGAVQSVKQETNSEEITECSNFSDHLHLCSVCGENSNKKHNCKCPRPTNNTKVPYICQVCSEEFLKISEFEEHRCVKEPCGYGLYYITDKKTCLLAQEIDQGYIRKRPEKLKNDLALNSSRKRARTSKVILCERCGNSIAEGESCKCIKDKTFDHTFSTSPKKNKATLLCTQCGGEFSYTELCQCEHTGFSRVHSKTLARFDLSDEVQLCPQCGGTFAKGSTCKCENDPIIISNVCSLEASSNLDIVKGEEACSFKSCDNTKGQDTNHKCEDSIVNVDPQLSSPVVKSTEMHLCKECGFSFVQGNPCECKKSISHTNFPGIAILNVISLASEMICKGKRENNPKGQSFCQDMNRKCEGSIANVDPKTSSPIGKSTEKRLCKACGSSFVQDNPCECKIKSFSYNNFPDVAIDSETVCKQPSSNANGKLIANGKLSEHKWEIRETGNNYFFFDVRTEDIPHVCKVCSKQFVEHEELQQHLKQHFQGHSEICPYKNKISVRECKYCHMAYRYVFTASGKNLVFNSEVSSGSETQKYRTVSEPNSDYYLCERCKKLFRSSRKLDKNEAHFCSWCDSSHSKYQSAPASVKAEETNGAVASAKTTDPKEEPLRPPHDENPGELYKCGLCFKVYMYACDLKFHFFKRHYVSKNIVTRNKMWEKWQAIFNCTTGSELHNHNINFLNCKRCALQFPKEQDLNKHIRLHYPEIPYRCNVFI